MVPASAKGHTNMKAKTIQNTGDIGETFKHSTISYYNFFLLKFLNYCKYMNPKQSLLIISINNFIFGHYYRI